MNSNLLNATADGKIYVDAMGHPISGSSPGCCCNAADCEAVADCYHVCLTIPAFTYTSFNFLPNTSGGTTFNFAGGTFCACLNRGSGAIENQWTGGAAYILGNGAPLGINLSAQADFEIDDYGNLNRSIPCFSLNGYDFTHVLGPASSAGYFLPSTDTDGINSPYENPALVTFGFAFDSINSFAGQSPTGTFTVPITLTSNIGGFPSAASDRWNGEAPFKHYPSDPNSGYAYNLAGGTVVVGTDCSPCGPPCNFPCGTLANCYQVSGSLLQINVSGNVVTSSTVLSTGFSAPAYQTGACTFATANTAAGVITITPDMTRCTYNLSNGTFVSTKPAASDPAGFYKDDPETGLNVGQGTSLPNGTNIILKGVRVEPCTSPCDSVFSTLPTAYTVEADLYYGTWSGGAVVSETKIASIVVTIVGNGDAGSGASGGSTLPGTYANYSVHVTDTAGVTGPPGSDIDFTIILTPPQDASHCWWTLNVAGGVSEGLLNLKTVGVDPPGAYSDPDADPEMTPTASGMFLYFRNADILP